MQQTNPYTFRTDAWHCRLFKWCYGIEPHKTFPTMCPYFWSMMGTLLILPFICLARLSKVPAKNVGAFVKKSLERCKEVSTGFSERRKKRRYERLAMEQKLAIKRLEPYFRAAYSTVVEKKSDMTLQEVGIFLRELNLYKKYYSLSDALDSFFDSMFGVSQYHDGALWLNFYKGSQLLLSYAQKKKEDEEWRITEERAKRRQEQYQKVELVIKESKENVFVKYFVLLLMTAALISTFFTIGYGVYLFVTTFITPYAVYIFRGLPYFILALSFILLLVWFLRCWGEVIVESIANAFKAIGRFFCWLGEKIVAFLRLFSFMARILDVFLWIGTGFRIIIGTIVALYNKYCPIITWVEPEKT